MNSAFRPQDVSSRVLGETLGVADRPEVLEEIKYVIRQQTAKSCNFNRSFSKQDPAQIAKIRGWISRYFPEIFKDPSLNQARLQNRMKCAMVYCEKNFISYRHSISTQQGQGRRNITPRAPQRMAQVQHIAQPVRGSMILPRSRERAVQAKRVSTRLAAQSSQRPTFVPSSNSTIATAKTSPLERRIDEVATFLSSCQPNMGFLLNSFMSFGCRNRQFLAAVAKHGEDEIDGFLRKVVACTPSIKAIVSEMDYWVLKQHFKMVFGERPSE